MNSSPDAVLTVVPADDREVVLSASGLARRFATDYTPTTLVIFRDGGAWQPVSVGVETLESVEEGVYRALRYVLGETDPSQYPLQEFQQGGP